jgi:hypothetical protein
MGKLTGTDAKTLVRELKRLGLPWRLKPGCKKHYKFLITLQDGRVLAFTTSRSPSDVRSVRNMLSRFHRTLRQGGCG